MRTERNLEIGKFGNLEILKFINMSIVKKFKGFNTRLPQSLRKPYQLELEKYGSFLGQQHFANAWHHLERAHIIGQSYPFAHTYVHWLMLKFGFTIKSSKEILGQIPRLLVGGVKSFVGVVPVGNTGGANVPPLKSMEIPRDLQEILEIRKS